VSEPSAEVVALARSLDSVLDATRLLQRTIAATCELPENTFRALILIVRNPGATSKIVGEQLALTTGTMTPILDRLEERGLAERVPNPLDRRGSTLSPTPEGAALAARYTDAYNAAVMDALGPLAVDGMLAFLGQLVGRLTAGADN
jgi:DNA-binding MarR family transcriptional regulator